MRCADCIERNGGNSFSDPLHHEKCDICRPVYLKWLKDNETNPRLGLYRTDWPRQTNE